MATGRRIIIGFIHVCMINEYQRIFSEQVSMIRSSGLYDAAKVIYIGCLGDKENKAKIEALIAPLDKFQIVFHDPDITLYEFATLKVLKQKADINPDFYGFYIHSKGVSWPGHPGGKYWRDYMMHYNIMRWKDCVDKLDFGYDTCGVKMVNYPFLLHYSGNFFWFKSAYARRLMPFNQLNQKDRFNAELWACSGQPICATLCQDFVDYNTQGEFTP